MLFCACSCFCLPFFFAIVFLFDVVVLVVALHAYCCCFPIIFAVFPRFPTFFSKIAQLLVVCCCFQFVGLFLINFFFVLFLFVVAVGYIWAPR